MSSILSKLKHAPAFETRKICVDAYHYNLVQTGLKRLGSPLRFALPKSPTLDLHLEKEAWVVLGKGQNDAPVLAWLEFDATHRCSLHEELPCSLMIYQSDAGSLIKSVLEAMTLLLGEQLDQPDDGDAEVLPLKK